MAQPEPQPWEPKLWTVGELIAKARKDAGMEHQEDLLAALKAEGYEMSRGRLSRWETNKSVPPVDVLAAIARVTGAKWLMAAVAQLFTYPSTRMVLPSVDLVASDERMAVAG